MTRLFEIAIDLSFLAGLAAFAYGLYQIYAPSAFVAVGALLMGVPVFYVVKARAIKKQEVDKNAISRSPIH